MKIAIVNAVDIEGGAARSAYRLHLGLRQLGEESMMVVSRKTSEDEAVYHIPTPHQKNDRIFATRLVQRGYVAGNRPHGGATMLSIPVYGHDLTALAQIYEADVINLHWIAHFLSPRTIRKLLDSGKPVVWTLHDQWAFTGGCHFSGGCNKFSFDCANCPQLSEDPLQVTAAVLKDKLELLAGRKLTIVAPSKWMAECARRSRLFQSQQIVTIPYSVPTDLFQPIPKDAAKSEIGIEADCITLLFAADVASEKRKGYHELMKSLKICLENKKFRRLAESDKVKLLCIGRGYQHVADPPIPFEVLGYYKSDNELLNIFNAADFLILPSLEDNLPNVVLEAMSCGTPSLAYSTGGISDAVEDDKTGMLVLKGDRRAMAKAIISAVSKPDRLAEMGRECRESAKDKYSLNVQANHYLDVFKELLASGRPYADSALMKKEKNADRRISRGTVDLVDESLSPEIDAIFTDLLLISSRRYVASLKTEQEKAKREAELEKRDYQTIIERLHQEVKNKKQDFQKRVKHILRMYEARKQKLIDTAAEFKRLKNKLKESVHAQETQKHWMFIQKLVTEKQEQRIKGLEDHVSGSRRTASSTPLGQKARGDLAYSKRVKKRSKAATTLRPPDNCRRIAVDLTLIEPGGVNGGCKLVAVSLTQAMSKLTPNWIFYLMTSEKSHDDLAFLDSKNISRHCIDDEDKDPWAFMWDESVDLLFCPIATPFYYHPLIPSVSVIHEMQHFYYPQFFSDEELKGRTWVYKRAIELADRVVCVSEHTRGTVLEIFNVDPDKVVAIHNGVADRLPQVDPHVTAKTLMRFGLQREGYLLYPSNFWPHKNHRLLLTAFDRFAKRNPKSGLKLVLPGASTPDPQPLIEEAENLGLQERVLFPGFLERREMAVLTEFCYALIYPSLFEGFGMPVVEAMAFGRPVLCCNVTSVPEVAGEAAIYFDPLQPAEMVAAIEEIVKRPARVKRLIKEGRNRVAELGGSEKMAAKYIEVIEDIITSKKPLRDCFVGMFEDGWLTGHAVVSFAQSKTTRKLQLQLWLPELAPTEPVLVEYSLDKKINSVELRRDETADIEIDLPKRGGVVNFIIRPVFRVADVLEDSEDMRTLGCVCLSCKIVSDEGELDLKAVPTLRGSL